MKYQTSYFKSKDTYIQPKPIIKNNNQTHELDDDVGLILILKKKIIFIFLYFYCIFCIVIIYHCIIIVYHCIVYVFDNILSY